LQNEDYLGQLAFAKGFPSANMWARKRLSPGGEEAHFKWGESGIRETKSGEGNRTSRQETFFLSFTKAFSFI